MIRIENMSFSYPEEQRTVFHNFNMQVRRGELVAVTGASGSGKTTLIRLLMRELQPDTGQILVAGENIADLRSKEIYRLRRRMGVVFQDVKLLEDRSVYDNLTFCARALEIPKKSEFDRVISILKLMGMVDHHKKLPSELSGGQRAKIGIGRALMSNPAVLLCDEPTGNLDPAASDGIFKLLRVIQSQGTSIILATHDETLLEKYDIHKICLGKKDGSE